MILLIPVVFILMYLVLLRPQQQRVRRQQQLISTIGVGDRVVTAGGLIGRVVEAEDDRVWLELADEVVVEMLRMYVIRRLDGAVPDADDHDSDDHDSDDHDSDDADDADHADDAETVEPDPDGAVPEHDEPGTAHGSHPASTPVEGGPAASGDGPAPTRAFDPARGAAPATASGPPAGPGAAGSLGPEPDSH